MIQQIIVVEPVRKNFLVYINVQKKIEKWNLPYNEV